MMSNITNILRRLVVPFGASRDQARVVIATDDPVAQILGQEAAITLYWGDGRAFVIAVDKLGEPPNERGQLRVFGYDPNASTSTKFSEFVNIGFDPDSEDDFVGLVSGGRSFGQNSGVFLTGRRLELQSNELATLNSRSILAGERGQVNVTFPTAITFNRDVAFRYAYATPPNVHVQIDSGAGVTIGWTLRTTALTTTGFRIIGSGPSQAWTDVRVRWTAIVEGDETEAP